MNKRNMLIWKMTEFIQMFVQGFYIIILNDKIY